MSDASQFLIPKGFKFGATKAGLKKSGRTDFAQIAMLGARAAAAVGNDTGPVHLIAAAGAPTLVLFSKASDPDLCSPRGHVSVLRADKLKDLPVAEVARAVHHLLPQGR